MDEIIDKHGFRAFLNELSCDDLMEHAKNNFGPEYQIEILMKHEELYSDYLLNLNNTITDKEPPVLRSLVSTELNKADEQTIASLMVNLISEEDVINELMEMGQECCEDIKLNQAIWNGMATFN